VWSFSFCLFWAKFCCLHPSLCGWHHDNWKQFQSHSVPCLQTECCFSIKDLGDLDYFLRIEVWTQPKPTWKNQKPISSPMVGGCKLTKTGSEDVSDPTLYGSVVGALQYVTITRPKICFSVNKVDPFMSKPSEQHWSAVKRILRYLKGTISLGLMFQPASTKHPFSIHAYCNAK